MSVLEIIVAIFSILEAVAVIASLLFIGIQLRETRKATEGNAYQAWLDSVNNFYASLAQGEGLAYIYWKGRTNIAKLSEAELPRFFYLCVQWFSLMENLHVQYSQGMIPTEFFKPWQEALRVDLSDDGLQEYWKLERDQFTPIFRQFVDELVLSSESHSNINAFLKLTEGKIFGNNEQESVKIEKERNDQ